MGDRLGTPGVVDFWFFLLSLRFFLRFHEHILTRLHSGKKWQNIKKRNKNRYGSIFDVVTIWHRYVTSNFMLNFMLNLATCIHSNIHSYKLHASIHTYKHTFIHTFIHTFYIYTCMHIYIHTFIIHTYKLREKFKVSFSNFVAMKIAGLFEDNWSQLT